MRRFLVVVALSIATVGCGSGRGSYGRPIHNAERTTVAGTAVTDDAFAGAVRDLLASEPQSKERQVRLQGVVARQMTRAATRFSTRDRARAVASLAGAMYLVRAGELTPEVLGPKGPEALKLASEEFARRGDEGRARASYEMLFRVAQPGERPEIKAHLDAIAAWTRDTAGGGGPVATAGALEAAAVLRHVLEPSKEARDEAVTRTLEFVDRAAAVRAARKARGAQITRDEGLEAVRALETGATVVVAIHLRNADARGALAAIDKANLREGTRPELLHALEAVIAGPDAEKWLELARMFRPPQHKGRGEEDEFARDIDMLRVASFAAACEAYRLDATAPEAAAFVAGSLVELGMGEAAPAVLADAVKTQKDPRVVGLGLAMTMQAMSRGIETDEADSVRRTFRAAAPLLAAADAVQSKNRVQPSPAKVYAMMGEIEIREGRLDEARKLLTASAEREKSGAVLLSLARLDAHDDKAKAALDRLRDALVAPDAKDLALRAEILLTTSDVLREQGDVAGAKKPLGEALRDLAKARASAEAEDRARIERLIARALDRFGAKQSAEKALERALAASPNDKRQAAATVGQIVGRAFVRNDLAAARDGLGRGIAAELGREDLVYYALWVRLLERQNKAGGDNSAEKVLEAAASDPRWIGRVAAFGAGKLKAAELLAAAQTPSQKTEALFYVAADKRAAGDAKGGDDGLRQVIASPGLDLMEFALAKEIVSGPKAQLGGPVPEVGLP